MANHISGSWLAGTGARDSVVTFTHSAAPMVTLTVDTMDLLESVTRPWRLERMGAVTRPVFGLLWHV